MSEHHLSPSFDPRYRSYTSERSASFPTLPPDFQFTTADKENAEKHASSVARKFTDGWHKARSGFLYGVACERLARRSEQKDG